MKNLFLALTLLLTLASTAFAQSYPFVDGTWQHEFVKNGWTWGSSKHEFTYSIVDPNDGQSDPYVWDGNGVDIYDNPCEALTVPAGLESAIDDFANRVNLQEDFDITLNKVLEDTEGPGDIRIIAAPAGCIASYGKTNWSQTDGLITQARITFHVGRYVTGGTSCHDTFDFTNAWCVNAPNQYYNYLHGLHSSYAVVHEFGHAFGLKHPNDANFVAFNCDNGMNGCDSDNDYVAVQYAHTYHTIMATGTTYATTGNANFVDNDPTDWYGRMVVPWASAYYLFPEPAFYRTYDITALQDIYGER